MVHNNTQATEGAICPFKPVVTTNNLKTVKRYITCINANDEDISRHNADIFEEIEVVVSILVEVFQFQIAVDICAV